MTSLIEKLNPRVTICHNGDLISTSLHTVSTMKKTKVSFSGHVLNTFILFWKVFWNGGIFKSFISFVHEIRYWNLYNPSVGGDRLAPAARQETSTLWRLRGRRFRWNCAAADHRAGSFWVGEEKHFGGFQEPKKWCVNSQEFELQPRKSMEICTVLTVYPH